MSIYTVQKRLDGGEVDMHQHLKTSAMYMLLQEAAELGCEGLGAGTNRLMEKGLVWMVARQQAVIERIPVYGERITVETWPGVPKHSIYPRYYRVLDGEGKVAINASAAWVTVDKKTRTMQSLEQTGIAIPPEITGQELSLPRPPEKLEITKRCTFTVPYSYTDMNGHMNNTRYFDLAEDNIDAPLSGRELAAVNMEYSDEVLPGETIDLGIGERDGLYYLTGEAGRRVFRMNLKYK